MHVSTENKILFGYSAAFLLLLVAFSYAVLTLSQLLFHVRMVDKATLTLNHLESLSMEVNNLESSFENKMPLDTGIHKGYYLQNFKNIDSICNLISKDIHHENISLRRLQNIAGNINKIHSFISNQTKATQKNNQHIPVIGMDIKTMLQLSEAKISDMLAFEKALLALRMKGLNSASDYIIWVNIIIIIIAIMLACYSLLIYNKENKAKRKANHIIVEYTQTLEKEMRKLAEANSNLNKLRTLQKYTATGRIARMIAHEVRNPLTNINLSCEQLRYLSPENEHNNPLIEIIMRNSNRIDELINELLYSTQMQNLKPRKISINKLLDETLEMAKDRIQLKQVAVKKDYDTEICDVEVDDERMRIAFLNIIVNAIEAMPEKNGLLTLKTESSNNKCVVTISDNGHGIKAEEIDHIFEPYFTLKENGTGLGLSNTQNIILSHKGSIEVVSEPGAGSTFTITLDFKQQ